MKQISATQEADSLNEWVLAASTVIGNGHVITRAETPAPVRSHHHNVEILDLHHAGSHIGIWVNSVKTVVIQNEGPNADFKVIWAHLKMPLVCIFPSEESRPKRVDNLNRNAFTEIPDENYQQIVACVLAATVILVMGPDDTKDGLRRHLEFTLPHTCILESTTQDKMTNRQISSVYDDFFKEEGPVIISR